MGRLFDMDSPVMRFLNMLADLLILNFLMIICCIPVITAGAAFTGLHYVLLKMVRGEEGYLLKGFFKSFARNFRQATILWLILLLITTVFAADFIALAYSGLEFPKPLAIMILALAVIVLMAAFYIFPLLSHFDNTVKYTIRNAFLIAGFNLPKTILIVIVNMIPAALIWFWAYGIVFAFMFGFSVPAYISAFLYSGIFKRLEPEGEAASDYDFSIEVNEEEGKSD